MDIPPAKPAEQSIHKLQAKLRELFQLDRGDLDFGLYRVMARRRADVDDFLDNQLLPQVREILGRSAEDNVAHLEGELKEADNIAWEIGIAKGESPKSQTLQKQLTAAKRINRDPADTYNHLYTFFARYYDQGDFMPLRRYKGAGKEAYHIPYNGEEVKLHWANADQYYIKTTENYAAYGFVVGGGKLQRRVRFEIAAANNEKDHIKEANGKERRFLLAKDFLHDNERKSDHRLTVRFEHRPLTEGEKKRYPKNGVKVQTTINADMEKRILSKLKADWLPLLVTPCPTETDEDRTLLGKHLTTYTARNSFDYFIHKDLRGFLRGQLDDYLKRDVLSIDNLTISNEPETLARSLTLVKAVKTVGHKIIDFLAQMEDFQKRLWEKKKFVLETRYCVTLDKVPPALYPEIAKNKDQRDEWVRLFAIDEIGGDLANGNTGYTKLLSVGFLKANPYLVLDTQHFDGKFTDKLLAGLSEAGPLEEQMDGLLVHGENWQALNALEARYRGQVKCIYIDPPYNTENDDFLYRDYYKHSSWLSMIFDRAVYTKHFLENAGTFWVNIDDGEMPKLRLILDTIFGQDSFIGNICWKKTSGDNKPSFAFVHDNLIIYGNHGSKPERADIPPDQQSTYGNPDHDSRGDWASTDYRSKWTKEERPNLYYGIRQPVTGEIIYPDSSSTSPRVWGCDETTHQQNEVDNLLWWGKDGHATEPRKKRFLLEHAGVNIRSIWDDAGSNDSSSRELRELFNRNINGRINPKPKELIRKILSFAAKEGIILDYFAGSGTTAHAVINLNREDDGHRKYLLIEMGEHFHDVLLPRIKKVIYSQNWKEGKPQNRQGISQLLRYVRLESYEDTLDNLEVHSRKDIVAAAKDERVTEDYQLRYALGEETTTSASLVGKDFIDPFCYTLSVVRDGIRRKTTADLVETFNFLIGLRLTARRSVGGVLTLTGITANGKRCLILWRNTQKMNAEQLNKWFTKNRDKFGGDLTRIYVNGDQTLNALKKPHDKWSAFTIERIFRKLMFGGV